MVAEKNLSRQRDLNTRPADYESPTQALTGSFGADLPSQASSIHSNSPTASPRPIVISYGGGINSLAMVIGMKARGLVPVAIVFSDTRGEKPETYAHINEVVKPWLVSIGFPPLITICRADFPNTKTGDESLEAECLRLGTVPSRAFGFGTCADKWKIDPFKWWAKTWAPAVEAWAAGGTVVRAIGYDAGEVRRIGATGDKGFEKWFPLIEWKASREVCEAWIVECGLPVPPKSACFFCPSSRKEEILALAAEHPDLAARALAIEKRSNDTGRWSVKGLGRRFAWADLIAADKAARAEFPDAPVESCTTCDDNGCEVSP